MQAMVMGAAVGGIYGAGGGFLIGLISGLFTADVHYTQLNNQIQREQAKEGRGEVRLSYCIIVEVGAPIFSLCSGRDRPHTPSTAG